MSLSEQMKRGSVNMVKGRKKKMLLIGAIGMYCVLFCVGCSTQKQEVQAEVLVEPEETMSESMPIQQKETTIEKETVTEEETTVEAESTEEEICIVDVQNISEIVSDNIEYAFWTENIICQYDGEHYGYVNGNGTELTAMVYDLAYPFSEGLGCAMIDGIYGFVDKNGEVAIPFSYLDAAPFSEELAYFYGDEGYGFLKPDGTIAFTLDCDSVSSFKEGLAYFSINGKYGYINTEGQTVIEPVYQDAGYFQNGLAKVRSGSFVGMINKNGEEVIPIQYSMVLCYEKGIMAKVYGRTDYYNYAGEILSKEDYDKLPDVTYDTAKQDGFYEYGQGRTFDFSKVLLRNSITPKKALYWKLSHGKYVDMVMDESGEMQNLRKYNSWGEYDYIKRFALYDVEQSGQLVLYGCEEPCDSYLFPMSDSALYCVRDNQLHLVLAGNECGGSARGDYVCFWRNVESGETLLGTHGDAGGFGGFSNYGSVYDYENGALQNERSFHWIGWFSIYYSEEELLQDAHLFYNDENVPYTKESILTAETINEYLVNDLRVTCEEYNQFRNKYEEIEILQ